MFSYTICFPDGDFPIGCHINNGRGEKVACRRLKKRMDKKKEQRLAPTFVNLKSNTMKNTVQRYGLFSYLQTKSGKNCTL